MNISHEKIYLQRKMITFLSSGFNASIETNVNGVSEDIFFDNGILINSEKTKELIELLRNHLSIIDKYGYEILNNLHKKSFQYKMHISSYASKILQECCNDITFPIPRKPILGNVYVARSENKIKIGKSIHPIARFETLNIPFDEYHYSEFPNCLKTERELHEKYRKYSIKGEWFKSEIITEVIEFLKTGENYQCRHFDYTEKSKSINGTKNMLLGE